MNNAAASQSFQALYAAGFPNATRQNYDPFSGTQTPSAVVKRPVARALALIATVNYSPYARIAARRFLAHNPEFEVFVLLVDGGKADADAFKDGHVVLLSDLGLAEAGWYTAKYAASELTNALKPAFLQHLAQFVDICIYLDCDIAVFSPLTEMMDLLADCDLVLIPHMLEPLPRPEQFHTHPTRADIFNSGLINAGCFALNLAGCDKFLQFWH